MHSVHGFVCGRTAKRAARTGARRRAAAAASRTLCRTRAAAWRYLLFRCGAEHGCTHGWTYRCRYVVTFSIFVPCRTRVPFTGALVHLAATCSSRYPASTTLFIIHVPLSLTMTWRVKQHTTSLSKHSAGRLWTRSLKTRNACGSRAVAVHGKDGHYGRPGVRTFFPTRLSRVA